MSLLSEQPRSKVSGTLAAAVPGLLANSGEVTQAGVFLERSRADRGGLLYSSQARLRSWIKVTAKTMTAATFKPNSTASPTKTE
jgi:hypothetical protein